MAFTGQPGVATHDRRGTLDLVFSNIPFTDTAVCADLHSGSDHSTLVTTAPAKLPPALPAARWVVPDGKADEMEKMTRMLAGNWEVTPGLDPEGIDRWVERLQMALKAATETVGSPHRQEGAPAIWWTEECATAHREVRDTAEGHPDGAPTEAMKKMDAVVRKSKQDYWKKVIDEMEESGGRSRRLEGSGVVQTNPEGVRPPLETSNGPVTEPIAKAEALMEMVLKRFSAADDLEEDTLAG